MRGGYTWNGISLCTMYCQVLCTGFRISGSKHRFSILGFKHYTYSLPTLIAASHKSLSQRFANVSTTIASAQVHYRLSSLLPSTINGARRIFNARLQTSDIHKVKSSSCIECAWISLECQNIVRSWNKHVYRTVQNAFVSIITIRERNYR